MNVPEHYSPVMPYFLVPDAAEFIRFLETIFDAEEILKVAGDDGTVIHAEYSINGGTIMLGQASGKWEAQPCAVFVVTDKVDEIYQKGLDAGGSGNQEPSDMDYGRAAGFKDKWGNQWWLNEPSGE